MATLPVPSNYPLDGVPLGSIVAYVGPLASLPPNWVPCNGQVINAPGSPLNGVAAPLLNDARFTMGVSIEIDVLRAGGTNQIPADGDHGHIWSGNVDPDTIPKAVKTQGETTADVSMFPHTHAVRGAVASSGLHAHGSENRPRFAGVIFIIRVA